MTRSTRPGRVTLARALSKLGLASRTEARALILAGRVRVDGRVAVDPAARVTPERIAVSIDGQTRARDARRVLLFHKPRGTVTTRRDPQGRRTVFDVLGAAGAGLIAVGRLDLASTGLLVFTNDTQLAHRLTDPDAAVPRTYVVTVRGRVAEDTARSIERGIDGLSAKAVEIRKASSRESHLIVTLAEGKNRELRRLFETCGHEVTRVHRIAFGEYELGELQPGQWIEAN
ncbi:MAG TPA: pseudouridine synthase [Vicinamibacterales bacterium]|nr:pseudouridine synthase [Vicinamibacterales bacterium]